MAEEITNNLPKSDSSKDSVKEDEGGQIVNPNPSAAESSKEEDKKHKKHYAPFWNIIAWVAVLLTIAAWVVLFYNDNAAMIISIPAVICSALGIHSRFRRTSITMLVASGVLLLVFILFWIAIKFLLG